MQVDATKLWDQFKAAHPRKGETETQEEDRRLSFLGGMASAVGGIQTGEIRVVSDSDTLAILSAPNLWGEYREKCCKGAKGKTLEALQAAFLGGASTGLHLVITEDVPPVVVAKAVMAAIGMTLETPEEKTPETTAHDLWVRYRDAVCKGESGDVLHYQRLAFLAGIIAGLGAVAGDGVDPARLAASVGPAYSLAMVEDALERTERN
jgi:hypothetical protein